MTNKTMLEHIIDQKGIKKSFIAEQLGISRMSLRNKISGKSEFKVSEMSKLQGLLNLDDATTRDIFLPKNMN